MTLSTKLFKSTAIVSGMTLLSRVLGFVRDVIFARLFGASLGADAFFVAFKIPNFLRRLFAEGAFSQAFVPVLAEAKSQGDIAAVRQLINRASGVLTLILLLLTVVGVVAAPVLISIFAPGFLSQPTKFDLAVEMLRLTFPYLLFISLTAMAGAILNSYGRFAVPAFTPVLLNLSLIGAAIWLAPKMDNPVTALAWGVLIAGMAQLLFQLPFLLRLGLLPKPRPLWRDAGVQKIIKLMLPAIFGASVTQINLLIDTLLASFLVTGSVSWLYYSDRLVEFPLGVFGIALATVILPSLSKRHAEASPEEFSRTLDWALRWVVLIGTPAMVGLLILALPLLATLFQYGNFTASDTTMAARSLMAYSLGLLGFILIKVLAPGYYARQDMRTPVRIGIVAMVANIVLNLILIVPLAHAGLALATSLAAFINAGLLLRGLLKSQVYRPLAGWGRIWFKVVTANLLMALLLWYGMGSTDQWLAWEVWTRMGRLALLIGGGAIGYLLLLTLLGLRWREVIKPPEKLVAAQPADVQEP